MYGREIKFLPHCDYSGSFFTAVHTYANIHIYTYTHPASNSAFLRAILLFSIDRFEHTISSPSSIRRNDNSSIRDFNPSSTRTLVKHKQTHGYRNNRASLDRFSLGESLSNFYPKFRERVNRIYCDLKKNINFET